MDARYITTLHLNVLKDFIVVVIVNYAGVTKYISSLHQNVSSNKFCISQVNFITLSKEYAEDRHIHVSIFLLLKDCIFENC